jgi:DNA/RNA endonuclease YhcR with UshA esterase domain
MKHALIRLLTVSSVLLAMTASGQDYKKLSASEATQHVGEHVTVCGIVESSRYVSKSHAKPTFLNIGKPYPDQEFTIVIWREDRPKFGHPKDDFLHKNICVTGQIELYKGKPEIIAKTPSQIVIE